MTQNLRVSLDFAGYSDSDLDEFASNVVAQSHRQHIIPHAAGDAGGFGRIEWRVSRRGAGRHAGRHTTDRRQERGARNPAGRAAQERHLRAGHRQPQPGRAADLRLLRQQHEPRAVAAGPAVGHRVDNLATTKLLVRLTPVTNAKSYNVQTNTNGNGTWTDAGIYTQARRIVVGSLTPGTTYSIRARAIGGSTGSSDWSAPVSVMAT